MCICWTTYNAMLSNDRVQETLMNGHKRLQDTNNTDGVGIVEYGRRVIHLVLVLV
jgi:hypothetical protein